MARYDDILAAVYDALKPFAKDNRLLDETTELVADLGLDSFHVMELLLQIEDRFDISIPLNIVPDIRTVRDLAVQLQQLTSRRP